MHSQFTCAGFGALLLGALLLTPESATAADDCAQIDRVSCLTRLLLHADPSPPAEPEEQHDVLLSLDRAPIPLGQPRSELRFSLKKGLEYRRRFAVGARRLTLELWGPVVKGKPGLGVELKGLELGSHELRVDAYGNANQGRVRLKLSF